MNELPRQVQLEISYYYNTKIYYIEAGKIQNARQKNAQ